MRSNNLKRKLIRMLPALLLILMLTACDLGDQQRIDDRNAAAAADQAPLESDETRIASVFDLRAGDCYNEPDFAAIDEGETVELDKVEVVACVDPHDFEVQELYLIPLSDDASYPAESHFDNLFLTECPLESDFFLFPDSVSWEFGDRVMTCIKSS